MRRSRASIGHSVVSMTDEHRRNERKLLGAVRTLTELACVPLRGLAQPGRPVSAHRVDYQRRWHGFSRLVWAIQQVQNGHRPAVGPADGLLVTDIDLAESKPLEGSAAPPPV